MYRTATLAAYDVLDTVFVNVTLIEYDDTPGTSEPTKTVVSAQVSSYGDDDGAQWLRRALSALSEAL